ncbi:hypothetical protein [Azohydromonas aeria]|uniref:hypothetical protein n=1 Tax=Azohydromonas aeria TaxID=2590212 RepID=UPI0012FB582B|nr:hypothetical protein [Azohydromonas aeria]
MVALIAGLSLVLFGLFYVLVFPVATMACMAWATAGRISFHMAALRCALLIPGLLMVFTPVHVEPIGLVSWWLLHLEGVFGPHPLVMKNHEVVYPDTIVASLAVCATVASLVLYYRGFMRVSPKDADSPPARH